MKSVWWSVALAWLTACGGNGERRDTTLDTDAGGADAAPPDAGPASPDAGCAVDFDLDGDGETDDRCGGTDCNDGEATIGAEKPELCADGIDQDCDGDVDEDGCQVPLGSSCDEPIVVSTSQTLMVPLRELTFPGPEFSCGGPIHQGLVVRLELEEARSLNVSSNVDGSFGFGPIIALSEGCDGSGERACRTPPLADGAGLGHPALPPGTHHIWLGLPMSRGEAVSRPAWVTIALQDPVETSTNTSCEVAQDVSGGGHFTGRFPLGESDHAGLSCVDREGPAQHLLYRLSLEEPADVRFDATQTTIDGTSPSGTLGLSLRSSCDDPSTELRCSQTSHDGVSQLVYRALPAGEYTLWLEAEADSSFILDVEVGPPTDAPPGDRCEAAIHLSDGDSVMVELDDYERDADSGTYSCHPDRSWPDGFYSFELEETRDVWIETSTEGRNLAHVEVRSACDDPDSRVSYCPHSQVIRATTILNWTYAPNLAPGTYFVTVRGTRGEPTLSFRTEPVVDPDIPDANHTCASATPIPEAGGTFAGTLETNDYTFAEGTADCRTPARRVGDSPDAAFSLTLSSRTRVRFRAYPPGELDGTTPYRVQVLSDGCTADDLLACDVSTAGGEVELLAGSYYVILEADDERVDDVTAPIDYLFIVETYDPSEAE